ncbi:hypothetical protein XFPR_11580 [Xylella fastidiosa]|uniref:hypothetical protein n=1 Tax=Xylella fastidiosa TaxID=2371 RepID=UPI0002FD5A1F|nr:hypothetical protein [Xylella fastidiosa]ALQ95703.1 hypothetical protein XFUD_11805 [Xylella fastidiosa]ALQ98011.1 hypothetical protein XFC3_12240 [Xylella fastidiosa]ALR02891.1 hypothetical protein OY18_12545 [Xylella fastidiosa]ALR05170.1 hypothetical protein XFPR_11580 [Xylella fastidiosa]ALR09754.2 hypothetical protein XFFB_11790 [Xylella fastidiosa]
MRRAKTIVAKVSPCSLDSGAWSASLHAGEVQGIKVKWREIGWNALIEKFALNSIGVELLEVEV